MQEEKKSRYTEAQNKATQKYIRGNLEEIKFRVKKGEKDRYKEAAEKAGLSMAKFFLTAANEKIEHDSPGSAATEADYYALPENVRAELINGQIYYQAAPSRAHQEVLMSVSKMIANYIDSKSGSCKVYPAPFAVKLREDWKTIVEPDISVICDRDKLTDKGCTGAPDWIIEIVSPCNSSYDYIRKLNLYADAGVREYWIVNPMKQAIFVYHLEETKFEAAAYTFQDKIKVNIYDDLWIDFQEITL